jgi:hypothetical protein
MLLPQRNKSKTGIVKRNSQMLPFIYECVVKVIYSSEISSVRIFIPMINEIFMSYIWLFHSGTAVLR